MHVAAKAAANGSSGEGASKKQVGGKRLKPGDEYKPEYVDK